MILTRLRARTKSTFKVERQDWQESFYPFGWVVQKSKF